MTFTGRINGEAEPSAGVDVVGTIRASFRNGYIGILVCKSFTISGFPDYELSFTGGDPAKMRWSPIAIRVVSLRGCDRGRGFMMEYRALPDTTNA